ncbi:MAG: tetraacyldisaccharide 4'-kinase [Fimbriimonadaceae bacterium]|nr:tetraacyldisaccharide 4'-kinase [Fimbriimonadaceae bacterium]
MHWSEVWFGSNPRAALARTLLTPASWLYAAGWSAYLATYRSGFKKAASPHAPILCVGNLVVGGSGKTPLTMHLVEVLLRLGRTVVVSCSGYGAPRSEAASVSPDGDLDPAEWGDEPALFRATFPDLPLIVGRRRVLAAARCHERFPDSVLLLDDGFQHLPLRKDLAILLDEPTPENARCLPAGPYREPRSSLDRADLVLPAPEFEVVFETSLRDASGSSVEPAGREADVLCAIGRPDRLLASLRGLGLEVGNVRALPDHAALTGRYLEGSASARRPVIVTEKDWVKLRREALPSGSEVWVARRTARVVPEDAFMGWISNRLAAIPTKTV